MFQVVLLVFSAGLTLECRRSTATAAESSAQGPGLAVLMWGNAAQWQPWFQRPRENLSEVFALRVDWLPNKRVQTGQGAVFAAVELLGATHVSVRPWAGSPHCSKEALHKNRAEAWPCFSPLSHYWPVCHGNQESTETLDGIHPNTRILLIYLPFSIDPSFRHEIWPCGVIQGEQLKDSDSHSLNELAEAK